MNERMKERKKEREVKRQKKKERKKEIKKQTDKKRKKDKGPPWDFKENIFSFFKLVDLICYSQNFLRSSHD